MNPLDPAYMKGFNDGKTTGKNDATDTFHAFLTERMQTLQEIPGVGEKTAWKVHEHFMKELGE